MTEISEARLYAELKDLRKEINGQLDNVLRKIDDISCKAITQDELDLTVNPVEKRTETLEKKFWWVEATVIGSVITAILSLVLRTK